MNRKYMQNRINTGSSKIKETILNHINDNIREYFIVSIIFLIGIIIGVLFINNASENQLSQINEYISNSINSLRENKDINNLILLKELLKNNILFAILLWFMGSTLIGIFIVYIIVCFRGFCLGYTISSIVSTLGFGKGLFFSISYLLLQNIIFIPCILALAVSGMKLHSSIMEDKRKENIKVEILRHTFFSLFISLFIIIASFIEVYVSKNILMLLINKI